MKRFPAMMVLGVVLLQFGLVKPAIGHGDEDHSQDKTPGNTPAVAAVFSGASAQRLPDGSLFVPKSVQHELGLRTVVARVAQVSATVELNGRVIADPNASGSVQATQTGRVEPGPAGLPTLGQKISKGQILAYLRPAASSIERGNQQAQLAELEAQLELARGRLARYEQLEGAIPGKEIAAARVEAQALARRKQAVAGSIQTLEPLVAPASGVISAVGVAAGQVVEAKHTLFDIVDPKHLAVEALAYDAALTTTIAAASARVAEGSFELLFAGGGQQLREHALPLLFRIVSPTVPVVVGQPVKVIVKTARKIEATVVPQAALVRNGNGDTVAWIHTSAERFVARRVRFQPLDGTSAAVGAGLKDGERVVTEGAALLAQVR